MRKNVNPNVYNAVKMQISCLVPCYFVNEMNTHMCYCNKDWPDGICVLMQRFVESLAIGSDLGKQT